MDNPSSGTLLRPRLRLHRRSPSPRSEATPRPGTRSLFSAVHDEEDEFPTPRMQLKPIASPNGDPTPRSFPPPTSATPATETPAARLRALLAREPRSPRSSTPPAPPSEADSAAEPSRLGSSTSSVTRASLKDIFSRALREPGDTPRKGRPRRNSFDGSSMEVTPVVDRDRGQRRAARRSLSDEEAEKPKSNRRVDPSFRLSTVVMFDNLRARLVSSHSQLVDQNLPEASYDRSSLESTSISTSRSHLQPSTSSSQFHPARPTPVSITTTPHPSFQMSAQLASQSNLLEHDSEMQRAMGEVLNSESEASTSGLNVPQSAAIPSNSYSSTFPGSRIHGPGPESQHAHELESSTGSSANRRANRAHHSQEEERNHQHERQWSRPRLSLGSKTSDIRQSHSQEIQRRRFSQEFRSHSHTSSLPQESVTSHSSTAGPVHRTLERRGSLASLRSFDDDHGSWSSSIGSQADYRDRISEIERERNHEREREWNKRHPSSRPSSSLSTSSNHSFIHSHSHSPRSPSAIPYQTPTHASLQRKSSRTSIRSESPASLASSRDSLKEREQEGKKEIDHERERNWNSPRPHWSTSKSPSVSRLQNRGKDGISLRPTPSLSRLEDSDGYRGTPPVPAKLQGASPKADTTSATSPALSRKPSGRLDLLGTDENDFIRSSPVDDFNSGKTPGVASKFGWNSARNSLPPLDLDDKGDHLKGTTTPISRPSSGASEIVTPSQIPVRSRVKSFSTVYVPSDMSLTHVVGDEPPFQQDCQNELTEVEPHNREESPAVRTSRVQEDVVLASDEEPIVVLPQSTTPRSNPKSLVSEDVITDTETEVLTSPSHQGSPQLVPVPNANEALLHEVNNPLDSQIPNVSSEEPSIGATPPGTPPSAHTGSQLPISAMSRSFALGTPPRQTSFASSIADFRTPSPPHDLPDLPGPPLSSDDDALGNTPINDRRLDVSSNLTLNKTPKPPGAWAATPLLAKFGHQPPSPATLFPLESTPPVSTSTPLPRANAYIHTRTEIDDIVEDGFLTPVGTLPRAKSLPLRTPAPPGAWMATPGQSALISNGMDQSQYGSLGRKKGPLKVRFDVAESETSATEGHPSSPLPAVRLANGIRQPTSTISLEQPTTPTSREIGQSPRSLRKSPAVRLVDAYGRERANEEGTTETWVDPPNGHMDVKTTLSPPTPRRSLVRIVDAMGKEVNDTVEISDAPKDRTNISFDADVSVASDDNPVGHAEALARMKKTLKELTESLSDADRSEDLELNSSHLEQLEEVSQTARLARNQLAHNLQLEATKHHDLQRKNKISVWTRGLLPVAPNRPWNTAIIYCGVVIQLLLLLAMWRYAHVEAHRLFYTTYYDPLYPEYTPVQESSCFGGILPATRTWTLIDSYETIRTEGWWSIRKELIRAMRHVGEQLWERWGEHAQFEKPT